MRMERKRRTKWESVVWEGAIDQESKERASASHKNNDARNIRKAQPQKLTSVTAIGKQLLLGVHEADAGSCCILVACLLGELVVVDLRALELASITSLEVTGRNVRTSGGVFRLWNAAAIRSMSR